MRAQWKILAAARDTGSCLLSIALCCTSLIMPTRRHAYIELCTAAPERKQAVDLQPTRRWLCTISTAEDPGFMQSIVAQFL